MPLPSRRAGAGHVLTARPTQGHNGTIPAATVAMTAAVTAWASTRRWLSGKLSASPPNPPTPVLLHDPCAAPRRHRPIGMKGHNPGSLPVKQAKIPSPGGCLAA